MLFTHDGHIYQLKKEQTRYRILTEDGEHLAQVFKDVADEYWIAEADGEIARVHENEPGALKEAIASVL